VTNIGNFYGPGYIGSLRRPITNDGSAVFQTVGAGNCYLARTAPGNSGPPRSPPASCRSAEADHVSSPAADDNFTNFTVLGPQAIRDTNTTASDLAGNYDCLDWCWSGLNVTNNATLLLTNGVAIGHYGPWARRLVRLQTHRRRLATNLNQLVSYNTVQEQSGGLGRRRLVLLLRHRAGPGAPTIRSASPILPNGQRRRRLDDPHQRRATHQHT